MRITTVGLCGRQQAHNRGGANTGGFRPGEQPILAAQRYRPDRVLDRVVVDRIAAVGQVPRQRRTLTPCSISLRLFVSVR